MIISKKQSIKYSRDGMQGEYYQAADFEEGTTFALAEFTKEHGERTTGDRARVYFLLEGGAKFMIAEEELIAGEGDLVIVPAKTRYNFWPTGKMLKVFVKLELLDISKLPK